MSTNEFNEAILKLHTLVGSITHRNSYSCRGERPFLSNPRNFDLYGTPLDTAFIIADMDVLPKFKSETGVQKVNTIFLTDGDSQRLDGFVEIPTEDDDEREYKHGYLSRGDDMIVTDPVTGAKLRTNLRYRLIIVLIMLLLSKDNCVLSITSKTKSS